MDANEVISALDTSRNILFFSSKWYSITVLIIFVLFFLYIIFAAINRVSERTSLFLTGVFTIVFLFSAIYSIIFNVKQDDAYESWKKEIVVPYIENLPEKKSEIKSVKIHDRDPEKNVYFASLSYVVDKQVQTFEGWVYLYENDSKSKESFMTYKYIPKKLGPGFNKGMKQIKIYHPDIWKQAVTAKSRSFKPSESQITTTQTFSILWFLVSTALTIFLPKVLFDDIRSYRRRQITSLNTVITQVPSVNIPLDESEEIEPEIKLSSKGRKIRIGQ